MDPGHEQNLRMVTSFEAVLNPRTRMTKTLYGLIIGLAIGLLAILFLP